MSDELPTGMTQMAELPQYGIGVDEACNVWLNISFNLGRFNIYLCGPDNYEEVARKIHKSIMDAGLAAKRAKSGLVIAQGNHDATLRKAQGGQQRSPRRPRT